MPYPLGWPRSASPSAGVLGAYVVVSSPGSPWGTLHSMSMIRTIAVLLWVSGLDERLLVRRAPVPDVIRKVLGDRPGLRELEPETEHVALPIGLRAVDELGTRVQDRVVVAKLDVAGQEVHIETQVRPAGDLVEIVERGTLDRRQRDVALHGAGV